MNVVSFLVTPAWNDNTFTNWNGSILAPNVFWLNKERLYELSFVCTEDYPEKPPKFRFLNKIVMNGVDNNGYVRLL